MPTIILFVVDRLLTCVADRALIDAAVDGGVVGVAVGGGVV